MQDIQFALAYQIEMRLPPDALSAALAHRWQDRSRRLLTERDWVYRAIFLLARTVDHCYGGGGSRTTGNNAARKDIEREIRWWEARRPDAFRPLYFLAADLDAGRPFPTICYTSTGHGLQTQTQTPKTRVFVTLLKIVVVAAVGTQYICLSKALLCQYRSRGVDADPAATSPSVYVSPPETLPSLGSLSSL